MAAPKTRPTTASVAKHLASLPSPERRADCQAIARMLERATKATPVMWGDEIIGFGNEPVVYANGSTMDWPLMAFASRAQDIVLYGLRSADGFKERLAAIAPAKLKGGCVHVKRLADVDEKALESLIAAAVKGRRQKAKAAPKKATKRRQPLNPDTAAYNAALAPADREICDLLAREIGRALPEAENRVWHRHPVWFLDGNPVVGYSKLKGAVRLLFWSGQTFEEPGLTNEGTFKAAEARYTAVSGVKRTDLTRWLAKARDIQWDYKNIVRRKGRLERLK